MRKKTKPKIYEGSHYDSTKEPADQSNTGQAFQAISDQADPTSGQSMSGQNSECHPSTLQLSTQMIVDQLMTEQEMINSPSFVQSPVDLPLTDRINPSISDQSNRKRKISSAAGSAEQERQNGKEARTASSMHPSGSSSSHSEGNVPISSNNEPTPQSKGTNGAPQTIPPTIASKREHLNLAISSEEQEHDVRKHDIGLRGVMIKDKVDMVVAHKRERSERLTNENIQILMGKQESLDKVNNVTTNNDAQYLPTLKQVSYKPEPIGKLDVVPLFGNLNDGTSPPTQDCSTYGIGKGFKSLDMPRQSEGQPTYGIGKGSKSLEMTHQSEPNISASQNLPSVANSADIQSDSDYLGLYLPDKALEKHILDLYLETDELPTSPKSMTDEQIYPPSNISDSSLTVSNNTLNVTPSAIGRNEQEPSNVSVIAAFQFPFNSTCFEMCPHTTQKQCWMLCDNDTVIRLVDKDGRVIKPIDRNFSPTCITMIGTNTLLVGNRNKWISQIVLPDNTMSTAFVTPLVPMGICVTPTGELLVTMSDTDVLAIEPQPSSVIKYTTTGREIKRSPMCDQFGDRLFVWPIKVSVNHGGDRVAVVNITDQSQHRSHLVMLDGNLDLVARYTDHRQSIPRDTKSNVASETFFISDVQFDKCNK
ncbi:uncharacterized protein LOC110464338 [Mizuhopecten yessoensis]|uniref:uncharacterized protein LOC110464338 n=1 Tax=Mizuhopecten yessoensis TaxID=6573 RepID=UPI000B45B6C8|nr:uncharacterized protein LOC110464338 [Mizuhopecten yessoensis]